MSQTVDDLLNDLYPEESTMVNATSIGVKKNKVSNFDSSSDSENETKMNKQSTSPTTVPNRPAKNNNYLSSGGGLGAASSSTQRHHHQHIAFPTTKAPIYSNLHSKPPSCSGGGNTCYLSIAQHHKTAPYTGSSGDDSLPGGSVLVPTLGALRARAPPPTPSSSNNSTPPPYIHYSAFHVYTPSLGNGTHDYTSTSQSGGEVKGGGCPFITCAKCDHPVVRLQGARWVGSSSSATVTDGSSSTPQDPDLYLTVRNLYPDWGRLATCRIRDYSAAAYTATTATKNTNNNNDATLLSSNGGKKVVVDDFDDDSEDDVGKTAPTASAFATSATSRGSGAPVDSFDDDDDDEVVVPPKPQHQHRQPSFSTSTNGENDADNNPHVLIEDANAAAYCCQCSWFSVIAVGAGNSSSSVSTPIHTTMSDITLKKHAPEFTSPTGGFITMSVNGEIASTSASPSSYKVDNGARDDEAKNAMRLLCNPHGRIRAPLWVCKGHL